MARRKPTATSAAAASPAPANTLKARLARLGIHGEADLVLHLPLRYEDETRLTPLSRIADTPPGEPIQVEVEVIASETAFRPRRQLISRVRDAREGKGLLVVRLLNFYPSQQKQFSPGTRLRLFGEVREGYFGLEMVHPRALTVDENTPLPEALTPVYPTTAGLSQATLRRLIDRALKKVELTDTLPDALLSEHHLCTFAQAVLRLHQPPAGTTGSPPANFPSPVDPLAVAWRRIRFDELLGQQLSLRLAYAQRRSQGAARLVPLECKHTLTQRFLDQLPFALTRAQQAVWDEIRQDLSQPCPMQRLLQGDVGSGKTVVAALAMLQAVDHGWQGALMAPTEILAEQHYLKLDQWLKPLGIEVAWLSGSLKKSQKTAMADAVKTGRAAIVVGTHALIEAAIDFDRLGVAVIDEQHRFGVRQRLALRQKGKNRMTPHQLMMSATPIPRSLAMSYYADLDVSIIDELPPGRTPVLTRLVAEGRRAEIIQRVREACSQGRQAYWVCPLIEESESLQLQTALDTFARLTAELPELKVGLVHGRLKPAEKSAVMSAFAANTLQVLVATTVIEVGVDVPNACLMVIEHAERFGLAQLHQLRGRVGRGSAESVCVLLYSPPLGEIARARLKVIYEHSDGFEIARQDLALRGPGEFVGARQSGLPLLRYANLDDEELVERARQAAVELLQAHPPEIAQKHMNRWLAGREELLKA